jgi:glycosyltransferase involved in cell wall biosynthesis
MDVSVIIAVRNGERFIREAIASVFAQDVAAGEVIVVDGHSSDRTVEIVAGTPGVGVLVQSGRGVANAYNEGIRAARGEFVAFVSHDDLWTRDKLGVQFDFLRANPGLAYCTGKAVFFLEPGCAVPQGFRPGLLEGEHIAHIMETLLARRSVFEQVGFFDETLGTAEDVDWFARAMSCGMAPEAVPQVVVRKRVHDRNISLGTDNDHNLLRAVRMALQRKRQGGAEP